jgi:hypothetical protein
MTWLASLLLFPVLKLNAVHFDFPKFIDLAMYLDIIFI